MKPVALCDHLDLWIAQLIHLFVQVAFRLAKLEGCAQMDLEFRDYLCNVS